jgi:hypothetical protein
MTDASPLLPAIPGLDLLPDQKAVEDAAPSGGGILAFLKLSKELRFSVFDDDLGKQIVAVVGPWRSRAILWQGGSITSESYDEQSAAYADIKAFRKPKGSNDGPSVGPEFLLWLTEAKRFVLYHCKNTAAKEAPAAVAMQGKACMMTGHKNSKGGNTWATPKFDAYAGAIDPGDLPTAEQYQEAVEAFTAPLKEQEGQAGGSRPR